MRDLANQDMLHLAEGALAEIASEKNTIQTRLDEIDARRSPTNISEEQIRNLTEQARLRLDNPTPELMAKVFDLLDIRLHRADDNRFEGTGTIPIPEDGDIEELLSAGGKGEVSSKGPQALSGRDALQYVAFVGFQIVVRGIHWSVRDLRCLWGPWFVLLVL